MKRGIILLGVLGLGLYLAGTTRAATAPYLTLFADRAQLAEADCTTKTALPGTVPLGQVIQDMDSRGLVGTFGVVTKFINETTHRCANPALYPSWNDLQAWHQQYGWEATSNGKTKLVLTTATDQQLQDETCGSLPLFTQHGFQRAWGLFSYPNDQFNAHTQQTVLSCFSFGRDYANAVNVQPGATAMPTPSSSAAATARPSTGRARNGTARPRRSTLTPIPGRASGGSSSSTASSPAPSPACGTARERRPSIGRGRRRRTATPIG